MTAPTDTNRERWHTDMNESKDRYKVTLGRNMF